MTWVSIASRRIGLRSGTCHQPQSSDVVAVLIQQVGSGRGRREAALDAQLGIPARLSDSGGKWGGFVTKSARVQQAGLVAYGPERQVEVADGPVASFDQIEVDTTAPGPRPPGEHRQSAAAVANHSAYRQGKPPSAARQTQIHHPGTAGGASSTELRKGATPTNQAENR
jgi:hypothetical protein